MRIPTPRALTLTSGSRLPRSIPVMFGLALLILTIAIQDEVATAQDPTTEPVTWWQTPSVSLGADVLRIEAGGRVFTEEESVTVSYDPGDATYRALELAWEGQQVPQVVEFAFGADEQDWWVTDVRVLDGSSDGEWIEFPTEQFEHVGAKRGEEFVGSLDLSGQAGEAAGRLIIENLHVTAFAPGTGPAPLEDCVPATDLGPGAGNHPLAPGEILADKGLESMTPAEAEAVLQELGVCYTFRLQYPIDKTGQAFSERWCRAPVDELDHPIGEIADLIYLEDGEVVVMLWDDRVRQPAEQPTEGFGCAAG